MDATKVSSGAGFFTVDRRTWKILCGLDDINMAVAYLTICAGTGKGNRMSRWSAVAVQNYTGLAWKRAKPAIAQLIEAGFLSATASTAMRRPVYELQPFDVVLNAARRRMSDVERYVMNSFRRKGRGAKSSWQEAKQLAMRGLLWQNGTTFQIEPSMSEAGSDLIWLPNTLITGTDSGEPSPVKRLRQCRNLDALRLLVDLYHAHNLADDGGISRKVVEARYHRKRHGHCGNRFVWGFNRLNAHAYPGHPCTEFFWQRQSFDQSEGTGIWQALDTLRSLGLIVCVPHLVENEDRDSEPIVGVAWFGGGEPLERAVAVAANAAARRILSEIILDHAEDNDVLVPVLQTMPQVQLVDIYRLRYRPHTEATARWLRQMEEVATEWIREYDALAEWKMSSNAYQGDDAASRVFSRYLSKILKGFQGRNKTNRNSIPQSLRLWGRIAMMFSKAIHRSTGELKYEKPTRVLSTCISGRRAGRGEENEAGNDEETAATPCKAGQRATPAVWLSALPASGRIRRRGVA